MSGNFDESFERTLTRQSWCFYSVGAVMIVTRLYARARKLGISGYQIDDYLMILAAGLYTALIVTLNTIADGGGSNLYPPSLEGTFTEEEIKERIYGSKIVIISEQAMLNVIYVLKTCVLIMFARLTMGLQRDQRLVQYLAGYVAAGWLASEIAFFTACRPFDGYWAVPPPNPQCTTLEHYALVQGCFNISADVLMLGIPLPVIAGMRLPWRQKLVLMVVFSLGVFVIVAALLTKVFNLTDVYSPAYMLWYVREASVAVYVSNLPMIWPLLREWFPCLRKLTPGATTPQARYDAAAAAAATAAAAAAATAATAATATAAHQHHHYHHHHHHHNSNGKLMNTPAMAGTTTKLFMLGGHGPGEGSEDVLLSSPDEVQMRKSKGLSSFVMYDEIELGMKGGGGGGGGDMDSDDYHHHQHHRHSGQSLLFSPNKKMAQPHFFSSMSGWRRRQRSSSSSSSSSSKNNNSGRQMGSQGLAVVDLLPAQADGRRPAGHLDAPPKAVTRIEAGARAARAASARSLAEYPLATTMPSSPTPTPTPTGTRGEDTTVYHTFPPQERGGIQVQTTFGVREEEEEEEEGWNSRPRMRSPSDEETGTHW